MSNLQKALLIAVVIILNVAIAAKAQILVALIAALGIGLCVWILTSTGTFRIGKR